jgi:hypothetical protein
LVRIEPAKPVEVPPITQVPPRNAKLAKTTPLPKGRKLTKKQKLTSPPPPAPPASTATQPEVSQKSSPTIPSPIAVAPPSAQPEPTATPAVSAPPAVALLSPVPNATEAPVLPAQPVPADSSGAALASTAGGGTWKTFPAGKMPLGRLIGPGDLRDIAERGLAGERVYLRGQFVVNFADANRAVLRPRTKLTENVLRFGAGSPTRIIVEFPAGYTPPRQGSVVNRDEARPLEITEVRKQEDGQLNVFAREIMQ